MSLTAPARRTAPLWIVLILFALPSAAAYYWHQHLKAQDTVPKSTAAGLWIQPLLPLPIAVPHQWILYSPTEQDPRFAEQLRASLGTAAPEIRCVQRAEWSPEILDILAKQVPPETAWILIDPLGRPLLYYPHTQGSDAPASLFRGMRSDIKRLLAANVRRF